jgi:hypothetical protein
MRDERPAPTSRGPTTGVNRRRHARAAVASKARLLIETPQGLATLSGYVLDISVSGCALRLQVRVDAHLAGRVQLPINGQDVWLPIVARWARQDLCGRAVGAEFDRPTREKQELVRRFVWSRLQ